MLQEPETVVVELHGLVLERYCADTYLPVLSFAQPLLVETTETFVHLLYDPALL